jgi:DMATS type aromatic prenyltransferase
LTTLAQFCGDRLAAVCDRTNFAARKQEILDVYHDLSTSWGCRRIDERPPWSGGACDLTPFEISVAFSPAGAKELRFVLEPQGEPPCPASYWEATRALFDILEDKWDAQLSKLRRIEDLVEPTMRTWAEEEGGSCTGYGAVFSGERRGFKFWFNPECQGVAARDNVCREAMRRLGLLEAWLWTRERLPEVTSLLIGLELGDETDARVKVYARVKDPNFEKVEGVASLATNYIPGDLTTFWASLGWVKLPMMRPHAVCLHFVAGVRQPVSCALQFATYPFLPNDALVRRCIRASLLHYGINGHFYDSTLSALAGQSDLEREAFFHSWVSFQRGKHAEPRMAIYFPGRAYFPVFGALGDSSASALRSTDLVKKRRP